MALKVNGQDINKSEPNSKPAFSANKRGDDPVVMGTQRDAYRKVSMVKQGVGQPSTSNVINFPSYKTAQFAGGDNVAWSQPSFFSPIHTPQNWQIPSRRREVAQWCRFFYYNEPKAAAGIDFYRDFPMTDFTLEFDDADKSRQFFFEDLIENLDLEEVLTDISHEYFLLGDVFPFKEVQCPTCGGSTVLPDGTICEHAGGTFKKIKILNPDYITIKENEITGERQILLTPDDQLKVSVQEALMKKETYGDQQSRILNMLASGAPIPLSNFSCSHIKHHGSKYGTYGTPLLQRLFTTLAYKTKLITANWIIADRLILPIRIFKVGSSERPATQNDINQLTAQITQIANNPQQTLVTHHAVDVEWVGASSSIHNMTQEMEQIGKEILDGLMLNQNILSGEAGSYSSAQVGIEILIKRLEKWRKRLKKWVEKEIFLPVAKMQGFLDEDRTKKLGKNVYAYPRMVWDDLNLRDNTNLINTYIQLVDKHLVSPQRLLEELGLDFDIEQRRIREASIQTGPGGADLGMGGAPSMGGGLGDLGGGLGDLGGGLGDLGGGMGDLGGGMGDLGGGMGDMTGGAELGSGAPNMGDMGSAAGTQKLPKIKKGGKKDEEQPLQTQELRLTSLEQKVYRILKTIPINGLFLQYKVKTPNATRPYVMDFAYPKLKIDIECDGDKWHSDKVSTQKDIERDSNLALQGWVVQRLPEDLIGGDPSVVRDLLIKTITEVMSSKRKKYTNK